MCNKIRHDGHRRGIVVWFFVLLLAQAAGLKPALGEEEIAYDVVDESAARWIIDSYNPKFVKMYAAQNRVSYEEAGLVAIGLICGDRPFFPKRFKQFRIAVPLPMGDEYLVATLDAQDVLFVRNMKDASQVARYLAPSVKKVGSAEIPKNRKKKKSR